MLRTPQLCGVKAKKQFQGKGSPEKGKIQRKHQEDKKTYLYYLLPYESP